MRVEAWKSSKNVFTLFDAIRTEPFSFFLYHERYVLLGHRPFLTFKSQGESIKIHLQEDIQSYTSASPLSELKKLFSNYASSYSGEPFFQGGLVGYFGYDLSRTLEKMTDQALNDQPLPDILTGFYDCVYIYDRLESKEYFVSIPLPHETARETADKIKTLRERLLSPSSTKSDSDPILGEKDIVSNFNKNEYLRAIQKAKHYIAQGDIYQINLSQRFTTSYRGDSFALFKQLIRENPAPYASFFHTPELTLMSLSPEQFLSIKDRSVRTSPIKGTRPRGSTPPEDIAMRHELSRSTKETAELLMITDLERNDLGRVCEYGSIRVTELNRIEMHPTVFHQAAVIEGLLREDIDHFDCLKALFPGGSITGAPKIRAMEIIGELEPTRRNIYTGAFGYMGFNGVSDLSMVIRTLVQTRNKISFQVGGGIVADSDPESEYQETLDKGKTFLKLFNPKFLENLRSQKS